ncbi:MAG TPA: 30S ribosomal protein S21 [Candidatus Paceibacterota bacterium]|nr:30S ribosomal protein S21 [Candidatus Paceibacterota bacterium]
MIHVEIKKGANESGLSTLKRFTRKMQSAGVVNRVKSIRYAERDPSTYVRKKHALKRISRRADTLRLIKLGKVQERTYGRQ